MYFFKSVLLVTLLSASLIGATPTPVAIPPEQGECCFSGVCGDNSCHGICYHIV